MDKNALQIGVNLGGWLSQYPAYDHDHFKTFISDADIKRIAVWGMDHVRLPVDYPILEDDSNPGNYKDSGFGYLDACLDWCQQNGLRVIIDLHKAPGFAFDSLDKTTLFESPVLRERFLKLWEAIARHFAGRLEDGLAIEVLNEIVLPKSGPWNKLVKEAVERIRTIDSQRLILVGGNNYNAPDELQNLKILKDPNILYTFHFYSPITVTHQKAPWIPAIVEYDQQIDYPGQQADGLAAIAKKYPGFDLEREVGMWFDKNYLQKVLQPALDFSQKIGQPVYCGEFGVYEKAAMPTRLNWTRDFIDLLNQYHIGRAYWTYKALDFGLVDKDDGVVNQELVAIASKW